MLNKKAQVTIGMGVNIATTFFLLLMVVIFGILMFSGWKDLDDFTDIHTVTNETLTTNYSPVASGNETNISFANDDLRVNTIVIGNQSGGKQDLWDLTRWLGTGGRCIQGSATKVYRCPNLSIYGGVLKGQFNINTSFVGFNMTRPHYLVANYTYETPGAGANATENAQIGLGKITSQATNIGLILAISIVLTIIFSIFLVMQRRG